MTSLRRTPPRASTDPAAVFQQALASLDDASLRPEVRVEVVPAPRRLAPFAAARAASVTSGGRELASGRLVVLYDPSGQAGWPGPFRLVIHVEADLELDIAMDPLLGAVGWSWLTESLDHRGASYTAASGTVTRAISERFGERQREAATVEFELRASWTPLDDELSAHMGGWCDLLCLAGGLPPAPPGVASLPPR